MAEEVEKMVCAVYVYMFIHWPMSDCRKSHTRLTSILHITIHMYMTPHYPSHLFTLIHFQISLFSLSSFNCLTM